MHEVTVTYWLLASYLSILDISLTTFLSTNFLHLDHCRTQRLLSCSPHLKTHIFSPTKFLIIIHFNTVFYNVIMNK